MISPELVEILSNELYLWDGEKVIGHPCEKRRMDPGMVLFFTGGDLLPMCRLAIEDLNCPYCGKDFSGYKSFIELYIKMNPW